MFFFVEVMLGVLQKIFTKRWFLLLFPSIWLNFYVTFLIDNKNDSFNVNKIASLEI